MWTPSLLMATEPEYVSVEPESSLYSMRETPEPYGLSIASKVTVTDLLFHPAAFAVGTWLKVVVGGVVSGGGVTTLNVALTSCSLPARSKARA